MKIKLFFLFALFFFLNLEAQKIWYVKQNSAGNGTSWDNAYGNLQTALSSAQFGDEIWIAKGVYKPSKLAPATYYNPTQKDFSFFIKDGLKLYGGFWGNESSINERDIANNESILSGDFNDDDGIINEGKNLTVTNSSENAYQVLIASVLKGGGRGVTIDGFTIKGGGNSEQFVQSITINSNTIDRGNGSAVTLICGNNILANNKIYGNIKSAINLQMGIFKVYNNKVYSNQGNGLSSNDSTISIETNMFDGNNGGGISLLKCNSYVDHNIVKKNYKYGSGAGIYINDTYSGSFAKNILSNNFVYNNIAEYSPGITEGYGGGIHIKRILAGQQIEVYNNVISNNQSTNYGAGMYVAESMANIFNNDICFNDINTTFDHYGTGLFIETNTTYTNPYTINLINNIFFKNRSTPLSNTTNYGGEFYPELYYSSSPSNPVIFNVTNNLFQLNDPDLMNYTQNNFSAGNFFGLQPKFLNENSIEGNDGVAGTDDDGFTLVNGSEAIDIGLNGEFASLNDILGTKRPQANGMDLGAYEAYSTLAINEKNGSSSNVIIYPNPAENIINIHTETQNVNKIEFYEISGKLVLSKTIKNPASINIRHLNAGIYIVRIYTDQFVITKKVIKK